MKTVDLNLAGKTYKLCFNLKALIDICEKYGDIDGLFAALGDSNTATAMLTFGWLASSLANAGADYEALFGNDAPHISYEELVALCDARDFIEIKGAVIKAISAEASVKVSTPKNAEAAVE